jgi:cyclic pyranopterin phosphate synthase
MMAAETFALIKDKKMKKGNVLETARIAGVMAAKKTSDLIPMCHPVAITHVGIDFFLDPESHSIRIEACVRTADRTGVEMEAMTAVSVAALTLYDMCKSADRSMSIADMMLLRKAGGKSGTFVRKDHQTKA